MSGIIKVEVLCYQPSRRPRLITLTETLIIRISQKPNLIIVLLYIVFKTHRRTISTQSSSAHVEERDQDLWGTLEQDCL